MNCCCCNNDAQAQTRSVTLTFKRAELLYDAANYSFVEGDIIATDDPHSPHQVFDIAQAGNVDRVTRVLNLAHAECVEMLYPYTKEEIPEDQEGLDDVLTEPKEYTISLNLPVTFSMTTVELLRHLIHEYLVCRVLSDWLSITKPDSFEGWETKFQTIKEKIRTSLLSRMGKTRLKCKPF